MKVGARPFRNAQDSIVVLILRRITKSRQRLNIAISWVLIQPLCSQIPGWNEKGYLEPGAISEALKILNKGGISCSVLVSETIPVIGKTPQDNKILQNTVKTIYAMGEAGVPTLLLFMLEEIKEGADREALWQFFVNHHRYVVEAAAEADVNIAMHGYFPPIGLVDGNAFFARSFAELPDTHNGICYDPGIMAICGDNPLEGLEAFKERIYMVHIRDVKGDWRSVENVKRDAFQLEVFPGKGIAKVESVMRRLYEIGYQGVVQPEHLGLPSEAELLPAATKYLQDLINQWC